MYKRKRKRTKEVHIPITKYTDAYIHAIAVATVAVSVTTEVAVATDAVAGLATAGLDNSSYGSSQQ